VVGIGDPNPLPDFRGDFLCGEHTIVVGIVCRKRITQRLRPVMIAATTTRGIRAVIVGRLIVWRIPRWGIVRVIRGIIVSRCVGWVVRRSVAGGGVVVGGAVGRLVVG